MNTDSKETLDDKALGNPSKRQFLAGLTAIAGVSIATALLSDKAIAAALTFEPQKNRPTAKGKVFSREQMTTLGAVCAVVIPTTDTPGAKDVDCHGFIDDQLFHCHPKTRWQQAKNVLSNIESVAVKRYKKPFIKLTSEQQHQLLSQMEMAQMEFIDQHRVEFKWLKALMCFGYYTSEVGASVELRYQAIPGGYRQIKTAQNDGRNWGSVAYY